MSQGCWCVHIFIHLKITKETNEVAGYSSKQCIMSLYLLSTEREMAYFNMTYLTCNYMTNVSISLISVGYRL